MDLNRFCTQDLAGEGYQRGTVRTPSLRRTKHLSMKVTNIFLKMKMHVYVCKGNGERCLLTPTNISHGTVRNVAHLEKSRIFSPEKNMEKGKKRPISLKKCIFSVKKILIFFSCV